MFSVTILASGSSGNCALLTTPRKRFLVDAGLSARQIALRLEAAGVKLEDLDGIFITHEHIDHVFGLPVLLRKIDVPVYCNRLTTDALRHEGLVNFRRWQLFPTGSEFAVDDLTVESFTIPHDAADPVGFAFHCGSRTIGFLTDLGYATKLAVERVRDAHTLVIETNHDEKMLQDCTKRPWSVKQRILSKHGHLSNAAAANILGNLLDRNLRQLVLGHLSRDCNTPELAMRAIREKLTTLGADHVGAHCASPVEVSPRFVVADRDGEADVEPVCQQEQPGRSPEYVNELFREWAEAETR